MVITSIDKELIQYFTLLDESQKQSLLQVIKTFLKSPGEQGENITMEQYNIEVDEAMERVNKGEFTTFEDLEKEIKSW